MRREIKFRAWIPEYYDELDNEPQSWSMVYNLAFEDFEPINDLLANVEHLMQFTGHVDSNGKEIYEGDFLGVGGFEYISCEVVWDVHGFYFLYESVLIPLTNGHPFIVVGNVHENPELLKGD